MELYNGNVQGLSKIASGTPAAFCRKVEGGDLNRDAHNSRNKGIGGQVVARKGTQEVTLSWSCVGPAKTDIALWFPTTAGVQVANFPDFLVEVDDGTSGAEYVLSGGQPVSCSGEFDNAEDAHWVWNFVAKFALSTRQSYGTDVPVYNSVLGHTINDTVVQVTTDIDCKSLEISNDLSCEMQNAANTKTAGSKSFPIAYICNSQDPKVSLVTSGPWQDEAMDDDEWTPFDLVATLSNGTSGENIVITCVDFIPDDWNMPLEAEGAVGFAHNLGIGSGTTYNRVQFT